MKCIHIRVPCIIIPSRGPAYTSSIVRHADSTGAKLWPFAPHGCDTRKCINIQFKGVKGYNKNRTSRLGVPSAILNGRSPLPGLPSCGLRPHSGRPARGERSLSMAEGTPLPCGSIVVSEINFFGSQPSGLIPMAKHQP